MCWLLDDFECFVGWCVFDFGCCYGKMLCFFGLFGVDVFGIDMDVVVIFCVEEE